MHYKKRSFPIRKNTCSFFTATGRRYDTPCSLSTAPEGRCSASLTGNTLLAFTRKFFGSMFIRDLTKFYAGCQLPNAFLLLYSGLGPAVKRSQRWYLIKFLYYASILISALVIARGRACHVFISGFQSCAL